MRELSSEALDGALEKDRRETYFAHLEACPPCRVFHEELRVAVAMLAELPEVDASEGFEERVWARIASENAAAARAQGAWWSGLRSRVESLALGMRQGAGWSVVGVATAVLVLALVSSDPAPRSSAQRSAPVSGQEIASGSSPVSSPVRTPEVRMVSEEDEFVAEMPEAVREYLDNAKDLRLPGGADRYRRSNYSYPMRRVDDPSLFLMGESTPGMGPLPPPASQEDAAVISF
jgi:anti-sigma factor RsiW